MANILQVTTPNLNTDNRNMQNPMDRGRQGIMLRSVIRWIRPGWSGRTAETENRPEIRLRMMCWAPSIMRAITVRLLKDLVKTRIWQRPWSVCFFTDTSIYQAAGNTEITALVDQFLMSLRMDSPEDLLQFLQGQQELQARFSGDFFANPFVTLSSLI